MAEKTLRDLIQVLKQNDLNNGQDADRQFAKTEAVHTELKELNKMLGSYFGKQEADKGDTLEKKREAQQKSAARQKHENKGGTFKSGLREGFGLDFLKNLAGLPGMLFGGVMGGTLMSTLAPAFGKILGRTLLRGPLFGALALFGEDLIKKGFEKLTGGELSDENAVAFNDILKTTLLGSIFGKKGAFAGLIYGVVNNILTKTFPNKNDDESAWQQKVNLLGFELPFTNEDFVTWGSTIASFFAPSLILKGIKKSLGMGAADSTSAVAKQGFFSGFKPNATFMKRGVRAVGWAALIAMGGSLLADVIEAQTNGMVPGDLINAAVGGASMLALFGTGPLGIAAGLAYFAFEAGSMIRNYLKEKAEKAKAEFMKEVENYTNENELHAKSDAQLIAMADKLAIESGKRAAAGIQATEKEAIAEEAFYQETLKRDPNQAERLLLQEEIAYLKSEIARFKALNGDASIFERQLRETESALKNLGFEPNYENNGPLTRPKRSPKPEIGMDFPDPNFKLPSNNRIGKTASSNSLLAKLLGIGQDAYKDLMPPQLPTGGKNATVIDNSSRNSNTNNTSLSTTMDMVTNPDFQPF